MLKKIIPMLWAIIIILLISIFMYAKKTNNPIEAVKLTIQGINELSEINDLCDGDLECIRNTSSKNTYRGKNILECSKYIKDSDRMDCYQAVAVLIPAENNTDAAVPSNDAADYQDDCSIIEDEKERSLFCRGVIAYAINDPNYCYKAGWTESTNCIMLFAAQKKDPSYCDLMHESYSEEDKQAFCIDYIK